MRNGELSRFEPFEYESVMLLAVFKGVRCEIDAIYDCTNETCADITFCRDLINGADCVCPSESKYTQPK